MRRLHASLWRPGLLWLALAVSGCGFQLRGSVELPPVMARTYIEAGRSGELAAEIREQLLAGGNRVVDDKASATAILRLSGEQRERRVIAVSSSGAASAYELSLRASFELTDTAGASLMARQSLSRSRDLNFNSANVLGKSREEEQIYQALRSDLATAILQRIQFGLPRGAK